jgi:hypothetical protein
VFLVLKSGKKQGVIVLRVALLLNPKQCSFVQVRLSTENLSAVVHPMAARAEAQVIPDVMLATGTTDNVVNLQAAATIGLRPPAHSTAAVQFNPRQQFLLLSLVHSAKYTAVQRSAQQTL